MDSRADSDGLSQTSGRNAPENSGYSTPTRAPTSRNNSTTHLAPSITSSSHHTARPTTTDSDVNSMASTVNSVVPSIISNSNHIFKNKASNAVATGSGGLILSTFEPATTISHIPSTVSVVQQSTSRPPSIINGGNANNNSSRNNNNNNSYSGTAASLIPNRKPSSLPIAINRNLAQSTHHRFEDDNVSQYSASSLATSFSKSFLFGFLNNKKKDGMKSGNFISKEYWMKDETSTECFTCGRPFTTFRRKHHCRICGQIFCSTCTVLIPGEKFNHPGKMRVCKTCLSFATEYNDSSDDASSLMEESFVDNDDQTIDQQSQFNQDLHDDFNNIEAHNHTNSSNIINEVATPTPSQPLRMAIPATRKGESVEIPVSRSHNSRISSIHTTNFSKRKPQQHQHQYHLSESWGQSHNHRSNNEVTFADFVNTQSTSSNPFNFNTSANPNSSHASNHYNNHHHQHHNSFNSISSMKDITDDHHDINNSNINNTSPEHQFSDSEDERSMSLYAALQLDRDKSDFHDQSRAEIKTRSRNNTRSMERAQASLYRMRTRRKSKSVTRPSNVFPSENLESSPIYTLHHQNKSSPNVSSVITFDNQTTSNINTSIKHSELNDVSLLHSKNLLKQSLKNSQVSHISKWESVLNPILLNVENIDYNIRSGDNMDIRQYVKLKRLCGGKITDTRCIDGIVFSKNLALKTMPRHILNPKIALIMFPLEYMKSGQQFMSLEPVLAQEKEYLNKLVGRIIALNPDVILIGASISGLALKLLNQAGIVVAYNVKPQVIERIARLTHGDIVISMDKLALNLKLGTCGAIDVKTFGYNEVTKTYIFLSGCNKELGCTLLIRGGDDGSLRKVKEVTEFMVYAVNNLKLETSFYKDNFIYLSQDFYNKMISTSDVKIEEGYGSDFLNSLQKTILSVSPTVRFDPPFLLIKTRALEKDLNDLRITDLKLTGTDEVSLSMINDIGLKGLELSKEDSLKIVKCITEKKINFLEESFNIRARRWELFSSFSPDMLDISKHQNIIFLYSMVCSNTATSCIGPNLLQIDFYWENDMTLGQYIEHLVQSSHNICSEGCGQVLSDHYRSYVHGDGKVDVVIEKSQSKFPNFQNSILTWSVCKQCGHTTPYSPMSETTWKYSFGKYLEILFWSVKNSSTNLGMCTHDFAKDHIKYFNLNDLTVRMEYSKIELLEVVVPRQKLTWNPNMNVKLKIELRQLIIEKARKFFDSVSYRLNRVKVDSMSNDKMEAGQKRIEELKERVRQEESDIFKTIEDIYNSTSVTEHLKLNSALRIVQDLSVNWDLEFTEFENNYLPSEKDIARITTLQLKRFFMDSETKEKDNENNEKTKTDSTDVKADEKNEKQKQLNEKVKFQSPTRASSNVSLLSTSENRLSNSNESLKPPVLMKTNSKVLEKVNKFNEQQQQQQQQLDKNKLRPNLNKSLSQTSTVSKLKPPTPLADDFLHSNNVSHGESSYSSPKFPSTPGSPQHERKEYNSALSSPYGKSRPKFGISAKDLELHLQERRRSISGTSTSNRSEISKEDSKVMKLTNFFDQIHFETISKEFEMQRERERLKLIQNRYKAAPAGSSKPIVEVYKDVKDAVKAKDDTSVNNSEPDDKQQSSESIGDEKHEDSIFNTDEDNKGAGEVRSADIPQTERVSLMKTLTNFWADRSATLWKPLEYPLSSSEHVFVDSDVIVREDEPSSLIAFCLSSSDYVQKIHVIRENEDSADNLQVYLEEIMLKKTAVHLKYQFQEGGSLLSCKIFFAEQFDAFRRKCGLEENFIQSLSRCVKWDSAGGKSGSAFLKTLDDRLVIKELSNVELDSFVKFAPSYFEYMTQALFHDLPTVLAKVFGFYQIEIKNPINGKNFKMDVLIMENLFYGKKTSRIFDLKGSMRNRHVEQTGKENEVLLDENMVEYIYESPLFVREYDKKLLRASLWNDTLFLAKMNVMDYSLVIGIDEHNREITVGIIDCIRTFTWDKKLESWVKERGLVGGGTKEPTVVTPRQYKNRFREAMDRYILMVPDCWYHGSQAS